ncbi:MAG: hypothetical protein R6X33_05145 [Candidatus Brocadiia bacterium]
MLELYNLQDAPKELTNLTGRREYADVERDLRNRLHARYNLPTK